MGILSFLGLSSGIKDALRKGAVIIDVRTPNEFDRGRIPDSINIPVDRIGVNAERIMQMKRPVIFCCSDGYRSGQAFFAMKKKGMKNIYNGGGWEKLYSLLKNI